MFEINSSTDTEVGQKLALHHLTKVIDGGDPETEMSDSDLDERLTIFHDFSSVSAKLYGLLGEIPSLLGGPENDHFRSSISLPVYDKKNSVYALVSRDSITGLFYSNTHDKFRWGKNPVGIAGLCITRLESILISDLQDSNNSLLNYWVTPKTSVEGGVIGIPMIKWVKNGSSKRQRCVAVLTVSSKAHGFFDQVHLKCLTSLAAEMKSTLLSNPILLFRQNGKRKTLDQLFMRSYDSPMGKEQIGIDIEPERHLDEILHDVISDLQNNSRPGKSPEKAAEILSLFESAGSDGVEMHELYPYFEDSPEKERRIASFVGNLNGSYLNKVGIQIKGSVVYRVVKKPQSYQSE